MAVYVTHERVTYVDQAWATGQGVTLYKLLDFGIESVIHFP